MRFLRCLVSLSLFSLSQPVFAEGDSLSEPFVCAEVCARLICGYFEKEYEEAYVSEFLSPGESGEVSFANMARFFETVGIPCRIIRTDPNNHHLLDGIAPKIIFVSFPESASEAQIGHFSVVSSRSGQLMLFDPFASPTSVPFELDALHRNWTGMAMLFGPSVKTTNDIYQKCTLLAVVAFVLGMIAQQITSRRSGLTLAVMLLFCVWHPSTCKAAEKVLDFECDSQVATLGAVDLSASKLVVTFNWLNSTGRRLEISKIRPSCKCLDVEPSKESIAANEKVAFRSTIDLLGMTGPSASGFVVTFTEDLPPMLFEVVFELPHKPTAKPSVLDFGKVLHEKERRFQILAYTDIDGTCRVETPIVGKLQVKVVDSKSDTVRNPNSDDFRLCHRINLLATYESTRHGGEKKGMVLVPLLLNDVACEVNVPFRAAEISDIYPRVKKVTFVRDPQESGHHSKCCDFFMADESVLGEIANVNATISNSKVSVAWRPSKRHNSHVGTLEVDVDFDKIPAPFDATAEVTFEFANNENRVVLLPVSILFGR